MTVTYTHEVANSRLCGFSKLLLRWNGSVYKLFYKEFFIYIFLYTLLSICYRHIDNQDFRDYFEKLCLQFQSYTDLVPISFVLGFYVSVVVTRWWGQFCSMPWPDRTMMLVASNVHGSDHRGRLIRRTLMRYLSLAEVVTYRSISTSVFKRFPTMQHVIKAGFMTPLEYEEYERVKTDKSVKYFVPFLWFANLLSKARQEGRIYDDVTYQHILKEMNDLRSNCGTLLGYDWISIPLVYTQVVTVATYVFFLSTLLSRQYLDIGRQYPGHEIDLYVPIFTIFQFFFYVGWLKVAEQLINPFGEDDDDFEVNMVIDRNIEIALISVDGLYFTHPKLEKDMYWNNPNPSIPYTAAAANHKVDVFLGSTMDMSVDKEDMRIIDEYSSFTESARELGHDNKLNRIDSIATEDTSLSPPSHARSNKTMKKSSGCNLINFLLKGIAREDDMDGSKTSLLKKDGKSSNDRPDVTKSPMEKNHMTADEDSADSDVGHGGGSEDEGTDDKRRSSLSSLDEAVPQKPQSKTTGDVAVCVGKHAIEEPEEKPSAKRPKSAFPHAGPGNSRTMPRNGKRMQEPMKHIASEGSLKSLGGRFTFGKNRKSSKRKLPAPKPARKGDFSVPFFGQVDDERLNAQMRNFNIQKNNKQKSVIALQRNARRVKYPGNAYLPYKNLQLWPSDLSAPDYASMASGAEERPDFDSPFGSINSFATSVPSPRPLRFSYFSKRTHLESLCSSCMTSPGVYDDYTPASAFMNASSSKMKDDVSNRVSMLPFTEDLRRRLRVVSTSSPASSKVTSPLLIRTQLGSQPPPYSAQRSSFSETDDQLLTFSPTVSVTANGANTVLKAIGEATHAEIYKESASDASTALGTESQLPVSSAGSDTDRNDLATSNIEVTDERKRHKSVNISTSCPLPAQCESLSVAENHVDGKLPGTDVIINVNNETTNAPVNNETMNAPSSNETAESSAMHSNSNSETLIDFSSPANVTDDGVTLITETSFTKDQKNQDLYSPESYVSRDHAYRKLSTDDNPLNIFGTTSTADDPESAFTSRAAEPHAVVRDGVQPNTILAKPPLPSKYRVAYSKYAVSMENDSQIKCTDVGNEILAENAGAVVIDIA